MFLVQRRQIWTSQPQGAAKVAPNVIAAGLASVGFGRNLADGRAATAVSGTPVVTAGGPTVTAPKATVALSDGVESGYTVVAVVTGGAASAEQFLSADAGIRWWQFRSGGGASVLFIPFGTDGTPYFPTAPAPPTAPVYVVIATVGNGTAQAWSGALGGKALSDGAVSLPSPRLITAGESVYLGTRDGASDPLSTGCLGYALLDGGIDQAFAQRLIENPWQLFKRPDSRIFAPVSAGGATNATGSGSFSSVSITAPTASASASASASGAFAALTISPATGSASAGLSANASGALASISISAPAASAVASASASGSFAALSISATTASATASATASGSFAALSIAAPTATASGTTAGNAIAITTPAQITISAATASAIGSATASGGFAAVSVTASTATADTATHAQAVATFAALSINPATGAAYGSAVATGSLPIISLSAATGTASNGVDMDEQYPLAGLSQSRPLAGMSQTYPLGN